ncbi:hypothetical protein C6I20_11545 [Aeromicrobium sp. A1-2]|uniref:ferredoxin reductase family protein n=1 Tax=Aeromicrobium sp. A1-2 TaxID=2107713 RepID=UPI000E476865|nr:ferredoxin reductase family protein [Aeromicrobium sp. A1-2]AXT85758.1 hypothetical protein C6I20_11545 [Aeromicrobium sp. A1-2]
MGLYARQSLRLVGPASIIAAVVGMAALWLAARPADLATGNSLGQLAGVESILLMSIALVLISTLPWVETYFDGIDRAAIWHRRCAIAGILLLVPHILMSHRGQPGAPSWAGPAGVIATIGLATLIVWAILPRWRTVVPAPGRRVIEAIHEWPPARLVARLVSDYEIWRFVHRTTGLFVAIGFAHGLADATAFDGPPVLRWTYVVVGAVGLAFYMYREVFARRGHGLRDYQVSEVQVIGHGMTEISLRPLGRPLRYAPGQFAMLHLETKSGWHRHPFTLASSPSDPEVRVTIKALGDYTSAVSDSVRPGMPAVLSGPHGRFTHTKGTSHQIWVAGGVGVTPFLSWFRSLEEFPASDRVDFFYSVAGDAPYVDEIQAIVEHHPNVRVHVIDSTVAGRLTAEGALAMSRPADNAPVQTDVQSVSVFMCGPEPMVQALSSGFREAGVAASAIHREYFDWR